MFKVLPIIISGLALVVSFGSLYLSSLSFRSGLLPPEVATRLNEFVLADDPLSVSANFDFSISNHSSQKLFIAKCEIATDGFSVGGGAIGERFSPCGIEEFKTPRGFEILPGQTEFFSMDYVHELDQYNPGFQLELMGIDLADIRNSLAQDTCTVEFSFRRMGSSMHQTCGLMQSAIDHGRKPSQKVFVLVLQTGTGDIVRAPVYLSLYQPWPWGS
jgi:hypothetical protein